jgi:haloalkane dehalogenase
VTTSALSTVTLDDRAPWRAHYPFASQTLEIAGRRMHYLDEGEGPVLLLSHGNPTWSFHWRKVILALRDRYRLIAPDHLGCGLSDRGETFCLAEHIEHLRQLVEMLDLKDITLLAQDWGGAIGLGAALKHSDRFGRFVLFNTGAFRPWFIPWRIRVCRFPLLGRLAVQGGNLFARAALRMTMAAPDRLSADERAGCLAPYDSWSSRAAIYRFVEDIPTGPRHRTWRTLGDIEDRLPEFADRPVQLIWGMQDWCFTPECLDKFIELWPNANVERLPAAGHWVIEDQPEHVIAVVEEFLQSHPLASATT